MGPCVQIASASFDLPQMLGSSRSQTSNNACTMAAAVDRRRRDNQLAVGVKVEEPTAQVGPASGDR